MGVLEGGLTGVEVTESVDFVMRRTAINISIPHNLITSASSQYAVVQIAQNALSELLTVVLKRDLARIIEQDKAPVSKLYLQEGDCA